MFITKKYISRRTVLRGMGAAVALPFLESMVPAQTPLRKTAAAPKSRLTCIEICHGSAGSTDYGVENNLWMPAKVGSDFEIPMILRPLEPFRDYMTLVTQTDCAMAMPISAEEVGADHFRSSAVYLTAVHAKQTLGSDVHNGISIDQVYAQESGQDTPLPSMQVCTENLDSSGACGYNYSCVYMDTISWSSPTTPLPMTYNPRVAFEDLFGTGGSPAERATRRKASMSILDRVTHDVTRLRKDLDPKDRARLDGYLENVREIERRIQAIEAYNSSGAQREVPSAPIGVPDSWEELVHLMFDLQALAFSAEVTRISTMKLSRDTSNRVFPESGNVTPFHSASHHGETPRGIDDYSKINRYHVSLMAPFLEKLKNTPDGDGNLLDHSMILFGSPMGDSNVHSHKRVPLLLLGHASGQLKGNLHVRCDEETPEANVLLTMLHKLGVEQDHFGDSTGLIEM